MGFEKDFSSEMESDFQGSYMDYGSLKQDLKSSRQDNVVTRGGAMNHYEGGLIKSLCSCLIPSSWRSQTLSHSHDTEEGRRLTARTRTTGQIQVETNGVKIQTTFQKEEGGGGGEHDPGFFELLDSEFNKVNDFYKEKVDEVLKQEGVLTEKMEALTGASFKHNDKEIKHSSCFPKSFWGFHIKDKNSEREENITPSASGGIATSTAAFCVSTPTGAKSMKAPSQGQTEIVEEKGESSRAGQLDNEPVDTSSTSNNTNANLQVMKKKLEFSTLRKDYIELFRKLWLLESYRSLNLMAFSKILEKYDKILSGGAREPYMKAIEKLDLGSSDIVVSLMEIVKETFIKNFADSDRAQGMKMLRPKVRRERHRLTFSTGFSAGCVFSLIVALVAIIRTRNNLQGKGQEIYMNTMFPLYSWFGFVMLHIIMYAVNLYLWRRYKVNYSKIFAFKPGTELGDRQVLLVAFSIGVFALICVLANLDMEVDPVTEKFEALTELLPLFLLIGIFGVLAMPFDLFYFTNRKYYLTYLLHCIAAPFYKVSFADSFFGDQLTSEVQAFRSFEFYICYYGWGDFRRRINTCTKSRAYNGFFFIVAVIPYFSRLLQCLRRLFEDKNREQAWNGLKYLLTIVAVCLRTAYSIQEGQMAWRVLAMITSVVAAIFGTYWDFVHDWGLLHRRSTNPWLRDNLLLPQKEVYFIAMILNVLLRFAWIQTVLDFNLPFRHSKQTMVAVVASLEIIRRGIWNFFRLENEHLNNVAKDHQSSTVENGDKNA